MRLRKPTALRHQNPEGKYSRIHPKRQLLNKTTILHQLNSFAIIQNVRTTDVQGCPALQTGN